MKMESLENLEYRLIKNKEVNLRLNVNRLSFNIEKTNFVIFHPFGKPLKYNITKKIIKMLQLKYIVKYQEFSLTPHELGKTIFQTCLRNYQDNLDLCSSTDYAKCITGFILYSTHGIHVWGSTKLVILISRIHVLQKTQ